MPPAGQPPPPRRSSRIKRKAEQLAAAPEPPPEPPRSPKRVRPAPRKRAADQKPPSSSIKYEPSTDTLFLSSNYTSFSWTPTVPTRKGTVDLAKTISDFDGNVHEYFISKKAGVHAATTGNPSYMYRHIGALRLKCLRTSNTHIQEWKKSTDEHISLTSDFFRDSRAENSELINALFSMTTPYQEPYQAPYIVLLAERKACAAINLKTGSDLTVQVYIGRLLFELIAYEDIRILFNSLDPSVPFKPLPAPNSAPQTLAKSPQPATDDSFTLSGLLRRAESTGYNSLTPEQRRKIRQYVNVDLYAFQEQTVRWMLDKEDDLNSINDYFWEQRSFTNLRNNDENYFYYFPRAGELRLRKPPSTRGGMVTEEMGLGKTIEALALIAAQKEPHELQELEIYCEEKPRGVTIIGGKVSVSRLRLQNQENYDFGPCPLNFGDEIIDYDPEEPYPKLLKVRRWPAKSSLVLCPVSLLGQWKREAKERAPNLSLTVWNPSLGKGKIGTESTVAVGEDASDIVLATYEALARDPMLSKITWKRLILDEAQVTRRSSAQVAKDTFNLRSHSRFLMTGTPIVKDLDDLRGELAFLRIWPFTLLEDGFWEVRIRFPFLAHRETRLIDHLLSITMMRHTKAQHLALQLPPRTFETIEVELTGSHRALYCFILTSCLEELGLWGASGRFSAPRHIRALLRILVSTCISPSLINLSNLDLLRRNIWARRRLFSGPVSHERVEFQKVTAAEAIRFLAETGTRIVRDSNRTHASLASASHGNPSMFENMDIDDLRAVVEARGILPSAGRAVKRERLIELAAGGVYRLNGDTLQELHQTIVQLRILTPGQASGLTREEAVSRLRRHYATCGNAGASESIHEAGFAALMKLIEKDESPSCPVCLTSAIDRVALTKCGHFYCIDCITLMFDSSGGRTVRCAICRREITGSMAVEVKRKCNEVEGIERNEVAEDGDGGEATEAETHVMAVISEADARRYENASRPTRDEAWAEYLGIGLAPQRYRHIGLNPELPSLDAEFLQHLAATTARNSVSPKLYALRELIRSCPSETKFCVVAETADSLRGISVWLGTQGISSVGVGAPGWRGGARSISEAVDEFCTDPNIQVFLLNTANSAGLTLTVAQYVVFMETMVRVTDEMQAAARVHRIGQTRPVKIVRIIAKNTVEEQIMFRRGEILNAAQETHALIAPSGSETPANDIVRLFMDARPDWAYL
eukprot:GFKZ01014645.1.p1 GENE.GFKZ01014645.1~~GFKZ01014645.1.p1  ORF type:complete len:1212 (-),score=150.84 GFKZ01014645.1:289-3924(-)